MRNFCNVALSALALVPSASAQINFFDNFDTENGGVTAGNFTGFTNFNVTNGTVDLFPVYAGFGLNVDLDGGTSNAGDFSTKTSFALAAGDYTLSFLLGKNGGGPETMTVSLGGAFSETFSDSLSYPTFVSVVRNFTIVSDMGTAPLVFDYDEVFGDNFGYTIDNVSLVSTPLGAQAPEPATFALVGLGLFPLALIARRRRALR